MRRNVMIKKYDDLEVEVIETEGFVDTITTSPETVEMPISGDPTGNN